MTEPLPPMPPRALLRWDVVQRALAGIEPGTLLEVGCGQGAFGARLAERWDYLGLEPDPTSFAVARDRLAGRGEVRNVTVESLPPEDRFDLVAAFEVLEHLEDDRAALASWVERVRPGGHLVLSVPAFARRFGPMDTHAGHFRRYDPIDLAALAAGAGLVEKRVVVYGWPLGYALEAVRNRLDPRGSLPAASMAERTASSGRRYQPSRALSGLLVRAGTAPFVALQRLRPEHGIGLVLLARRPL